MHGLELLKKGSLLFISNYITRPFQNKSFTIVDTGTKKSTLKNPRFTNSFICNGAIHTEWGETMGQVHYADSQTYSSSWHYSCFLSWVEWECEMFQMAAQIFRKALSFCCLSYRCNKWFISYTIYIMHLYRIYQRWILYRCHAVNKSHVIHYELQICVHYIIHHVGVSILSWEIRLPYWERKEAKSKEQTEGMTQKSQMK